MSKRSHGFATLVLGMALLLSPASMLRADLQAFVGQDIVELTDGSQIQCLVVIETPRGVLIIVRDPEKGEDAYRQQFIPANAIKRVVRGARLGETKAFQTDTELAQKVVQGSGLRSATQTKPAAPVAPTGPIAAATPPITTKPPPGPAPVTSKGALPAKELADAYLQRFPSLEEAAERLLGGQPQLTAALEKALSDPAARQETERLLDLFLQAGRADPTKTTPEKPKGLKPAPHPAKPATGATGK